MVDTITRLVSQEDTLYYVSWNRGVKGGGFNAPIFPLNPPATDYNDATMAYGPEQLDAFEIGAKGHSWVA